MAKAKLHPIFMSQDFRQIQKLMQNEKRLTSTFCLVGYKVFHACLFIFSF